MIRKDLVFVKQPIKTRAAAIAFIANAAEKAGLLKNKHEFTEVVFRREKEISTSIGHGIAIPHGKTDAVQDAFVSYVGVEKAFEWDTDTKDRVEAVFLIGVPEKNTDTLHLKVISEVSKKLVNDEFRRKLFACQTGQEAFVLLDAINQGLKKDKE